MDDTTKPKTLDQRDQLIEDQAVALHAAKQRVVRLEHSNASLAADRDKIATRCLHAEERADSLHTHCGELRAQILAGDGPAERKLLKYEGELSSAMSSWTGQLLEAACARIRGAADHAGEGCSLHGHAPHGREAEELRAGIESLLENRPKMSWAAALQHLLDEVDARDSLAHVRANEAMVALDRQIAQLRMELGTDCCRRALAQVPEAESVELPLAAGWEVADGEL